MGSWSDWSPTSGDRPAGPPVPRPPAAGSAPLPGAEPPTEQDWTGEDAGEPVPVFAEPHELLPADTPAGKLAACLTEYLLDAHGSDPVALSQGLGSAAMHVSRAGHVPLAEALWRASLALDPTNERSASALGQLLYRTRRYHDALDLLALAESLDTRARLYLGLTRMEVGEHDGDPTGFAAGLVGAMDAMKQWAYSNTDADDRPRWIRMSRRIARRHPGREDVQSALRELTLFANNRSGWSPIDHERLILRHGAPRVTAGGAAGGDDRD